MHIVTLIRQGTRMIVGPPLAMPFFSVLVSLAGVIRSSPLSPNQALKLNIGPWPLLLQNYIGFVCSFENSIFPFSFHQLSGATILVHSRWLPTLCITPAPNTLKWPDYHFTREKVVRKDLTTRYISTLDQVADIFTKGLTTPQFLLLRDKLRVCSSPIGLRGDVKIQTSSAQSTVVPAIQPVPTSEGKIHVYHLTARITHH